MLSNVLNIIGLICIIISIIFIRKTSKKEMDIYEEMILINNNTKNYSLAIESVLDSFDDLIESSLKKIETIEKNIINDDIAKVNSEESLENKNLHNLSSKILLEESNTKNNSTQESYKKILELKKVGLSNEEIAKKLNIGIREVGIIIKMWNN